MGIFKRFRASMTFGIGSVEESMVANTQPATYRPFSNDSVFSPGYSRQEEGSYGNYSSTATNTSQPRIKKELPKATGKNESSQPGISNAQVPNVKLTADKTGTPNSTSKSTKESKKSEGNKGKDKKNEKPKDKNKEDKKRKDKKKIKMGETVEEKSKSNKDKEKKKEKRSKNDTTQVASVTIDEAAVASTRAETIRTQSSYASEDSNIKHNPPKSRNALANPLAAHQSNSPTDNSSPNARFQSSWDQVAMHRENLHRELQTARPQQNNLRSMMNLDRDSTSRFKPNANSSEI